MPFDARFRARAVFALKIAPLAVVAAALLYQRFLSPVPARSHAVSRGDISLEVFGRGTVESRREAQLGFDMTGRISDVLVDEGDRVKLGQVLGHLAPEQYRADLRTATSGAAMATAAVARLDAEERKASATLAFAETEEERAQHLARNGTVAKRDLDLAVQQLALARAELSRVRAAHGEASRSIDVAHGGVESRRATAMRTALVSPFDGLVIRRFHDPGDPVAVGATILRVVATDRLWVRTWIDETALGQLTEGQPAEIRFPGDPVTVWKGRVDRIGREADRQTHELLVDVALEDLPRRVAVGQRADVWIRLAQRKQAVQIPPGFIQREGESVFAFVDRGGTIARAQLVLGVVGRQAVEVTSGLTEGQVVLSAESAKSLSAGRKWKAAGRP